ncbi:ribosome biogenesis GTPase YqeH [Leuconostocaceae bacterium ESL0723]|nr:ribosome biogenesis GTPase YqeH [Leuconostocaceae bacterium ESL0723]
MSTPITDEQMQATLAEGLYCVGCGAQMQVTDPNHSGYLPKGALKKALAEGTDQLLCQRCFRLRHYNEIQPVELSDDDFARLLHQISTTRALIVYVVDLFDVSGSQIAGLARFVGPHNPILVVGNKLDLLPKSTNQGRLKQWLAGILREQGLRPVDIFLTSAAHPHNLDALLNEIDQERHGQDVYVVGTTNVGKSTLINQIIKSKTGVQELITTSRFPGTTLDRIEIPLDDGRQLIDTPGIIKRDQIQHHIEDQDLKYTLPRNEIKPRTYQLNAGQTLFIGGLARFDYLNGDKTAVTAYFENNLKLHRTKLAGADAFYGQHAGGLLAPAPQDGEALVRHEFKTNQKSDLVYAGLGWITLPAGLSVAAWAPKGVSVTLRKAMI